MDRSHINKNEATNQTLQDLKIDGQGFYLCGQHFLR